MIEWVFYRWGFCHIRAGVLSVGILSGGGFVGWGFCRVGVLSVGVLSYGGFVMHSCTSASLVTWVGLQPFPSFSGLLRLHLLAGVVGVLHPVSGCSS